MKQISKNFFLNEFEESSTATKNGIDNSIKDNKVVVAITALVTDVLQPLRDQWGKTLHVNSGYRCPELNKLVGGVPTSQHALGEAADVAATDPYALAYKAKTLGLNYDQMILYPTFVHFSHKLSGTQRKQVLYNKSYKGKRL